MVRSSLVLVPLAASWMLACGGPASSTAGTSAGPSAPTATLSSTSTAASTIDPPPGRVTRGTVESLPKWIEAKKTAEVDADAARALRDVPPGATIRVFFGTWCGDSRRELSRFWKALDVAGAPVPITLEYIAVDHEKRAPDGVTDGVNLRYVPTFIVLRAGKEVGRVIESSPSGIEKDLGALLRGERSGIISGRTDVGA